jgi:Acyl-CoA carboxylase epsilon subunit
MSEPPSQPAVAALRIVRGEPTAEELAVVTAVMTAAAGSAESVAEPPAATRGRWNDPAAGHRRPWNPGPGAWRAAAR